MAAWANERRRGHERRGFQRELGRPHSACKAHARGWQKVTQQIWRNFSILEEQEAERPCQQEARSVRRNDHEKWCSYTLQNKVWYIGAMERKNGYERAEHKLLIAQGGRLGYDFIRQRETRRGLSGRIRFGRVRIMCFFLNGSKLQDGKHEHQGQNAFLNLR